MVAADASGYEVAVVVSESVRSAGLEEADLTAFLAAALVAAEVAGASPGSFAVRLGDDEEVAELNHSYRNREGTTDVLSFPGEETPEGRHLGDVVISMPQAARQAEQEGHSLALELRFLSLHGLVHCLGYDHESDSGEMDALELDLRDALSPWLTSGGGP